MTKRFVYRARRTSRARTIACAIARAAQITAVTVAVAVVSAAMVFIAAPRAAYAQAPDSLVMHAIERRQMQLADSTLLSYTASAHGFLAFLGQFGEGLIIPPKVVQSEELALAIAWWQPNGSAQRLIGRRDTTLLPAAVAYYRDRYGVVLDNLPDRIRLGDGQDVRDVPHPLALNARDSYVYERGSPLTFRLPGREIVVDEIRFRPRNGSDAAAIGSVYLDRESAAVVRLSMTFTRAAIIDKRIETLVVTLENGLINGRYWLPRRQEVEVSRSSTWLDIPARGIVRGHWDVANYQVNERIPVATLQLPRWSSAPRDSLRAHVFEGRVVDMLPMDVQVATSADVTRARTQAEAAVRASMLTRPSRATLTGRGISDFARANRAEGVAVGAGATHATAAGVTLAARARYGFGDERLKGQLAVGLTPAFGRVPSQALFVEREYRDLASPERAGVTNSLATVLFASDYTTLVDTRAAGVTLRRSPLDPFTFRVAYERDAPVFVSATSLFRTFAPTLAAWRTEGLRGEARGAGGWVSGDAGAGNGTNGAATRLNGRWTLNASLFAGHGVDAFGENVQPINGRAYGSLSLERSLAHDRSALSLTSFGVAGGRSLSPQSLVFAGGPWSAPGYDFHAFRTTAYLSQRLEIRQAAPAPAVPLGRYGRAPAHVTLAPYVSVIAVTNGISAISTPAAGLYPSVGVGALFFFDLVRADVARGVRRGEWRFALDIDRGFWSIL